MKNSKNKVLAAAVCGVIVGSVGTSIVGNFQASEQNSNTASSNSTTSDNNSNKVITDSEIANGGDFAQSGSSSDKMPPGKNGYYSDGSSGKPSGGRGGHHQGEAALDSVETVDVANGQYNDGTYTGSASGYASGLKVQVTISNGEISDIQVVSHNETPGFCERAIKAVPAEIISKQSTDVDTVSGATYTSVGIINAVNDALSSSQG